MAVTLRPVTRDNWEAVARMEVSEEQRRFVAPNAFSLAQAAYEPGLTPRAIYAAGELVGFAMYGHERWQGDYWIARLMIGRDHQGKGHGRDATLAVIQEMRQLPGCDSIVLDFKRDNHAARRLYERLSFVIFAEDEHSCLARLTLKTTPPA